MVVLEKVQFLLRDVMRLSCVLCAVALSAILISVPYDLTKVYFMYRNVLEHQQVEVVEVQTKRCK